MKLLLVLSYLIAAKAGVMRREAPCEGPTIGNVIHTTETLKTGLDRPLLLSTDYSTNTVYFSYSLNPTDTRFKAAKIDLNNNKFTDIDVNNGFAQCVDPKTNDVYIGSDGIYKYNKTTNTAELYGAKGIDIWYLFFKDVLYFTKYKPYKVYMIVDEKVSRFKDLEDTEAEYFVIDNDDNIFFANDTGLFRQKKGYKDAIYYEGSKFMSIISLSTDLNGDVYVVVSDGIYVVDKLKHVLKKHVEVDNAFGVTFDNKNNIVYSGINSVYKLRPATYDECN